MHNLLEPVVAKTSFFIQNCERESMSIVPQRALGSQGLVASAQGLGCMVSVMSQSCVTIVEPKSLISFRFVGNLGHDCAFWGL